MIEEITVVTHKHEPLKLTNTGKVLIGITGGVGIALTIICAPFVSPALRKVCLPYVPATSRQIDNIFRALSGRKGTLLDLGSGDGRIVIEAAKHNFNSFGIELNLWLVLYSRLDALRKGLNKNTKFIRANLWKHDLSVYDNVVIFGVEQMMQDLEKKFLAECRDGVNIVACRFPLPNMQPVKTFGAGIDTVWLYVVKK